MDPDCEDDDFDPEETEGLVDTVHGLQSVPVIGDEPPEGWDGQLPDGFDS